MAMTATKRMIPRNMVRVLLLLLPVVASDEPVVASDGPVGITVTSQLGTGVALQAPVTSLMTVVGI